MPKLRHSKTGKAWAAFPVVVNQGDLEAPVTWVRVAIFRDKAEEFTHRLTKGTEVYCEGRLSLGSWAGKDGEVKTGLSLAAWDVHPHGADRKEETAQAKATG